MQRRRSRGRRLFGISPSQASGAHAKETAHTAAQAEASMKRRRQDMRQFNRRPQGVKEIGEAREKADAERKRLLERYKDHQIAVERERQARAAVFDARRNRFAHLSLSDALAAARRLTFIDLEAERKGEAAPLNRPSLTLVELFLTVLKERGSIAVLQWPRGIRDISILHPLAMLGVLGSAPEQVTGAFHW